jgi:hypothetical protein
MSINNEVTEVNEVTEARAFRKVQLRTELVELKKAEYTEILVEITSGRMRPSMIVKVSRELARAERMLREANANWSRIAAEIVLQKLDKLGSCTMSNDDMTLKAMVEEVVAIYN